MSLIELKKQKEKTVFVTVDKASQESTIGLTLNYYDGGRVLVRGVADEGVFAGSELTAGLLLNSVNDTPVKGMSTAQVMELFTEAPKELNVSADDIGLKVASTCKESRNSKVGIGLKDRAGKIIISSISDESIFANTDVQPGQQLISVNGTSCVGLMKNQAIVLFKELEMFTVMTKDIGIICATINKVSADSKVGIGLRAIDNCIVVSSIAEDSLFQATALEPGLRLLQVNSTDMHGLSRQQAITPFKEAVGPVKVLADNIGLIAVKVVKANASSKVGVGLREMAGHIVISSIAEDSLFANSALMPGLRLVCVDNVLCKGLTKSDAIKLFKDATGSITVLAERVGLISSSAFKDTAGSKVGIGIKSIKEYVVVSSIAEGSIFANTPLQVGHRLVSVNKTNCLTMNKADAIKLFKDAEGKITVLSEEVGLFAAKVTKKSKNDKVGIGLKEKDGEVVISAVYDSGLFAKTDLTEDLKIVSINDKSVRGMSRDEAIALFRDAEGDITVLAENPSEKSFLS
jgi:C-terminal processing protease CtpA/Prc